MSSSHFLGENMNNSDKKLLLMAPMRGVVIPLERVPDPAFAEKMVGDGISIDPLEGVLRSPCNGEVVHIHNSAHAITIKTDTGIEVLLHIGLDTVALKGEGFTPVIQAGDNVEVGDELILFDIKLVAAKAPHLLTQVIVSTMELVNTVTQLAEGTVESGQPICEVELASKSDNNTSKVGGTKVESDTFQLPNSVGMHARPASQLAKIVKDYDGSVEVHLGDRVANAKSVTSLMKLDSKFGDLISVVVIGESSDKLLKKVVSNIKAGLGDEISPLESAKIENSSTATDNDISNMKLFKGVGASAGVAVGKVFKAEEKEIIVSETGVDLTTETDRYCSAIKTAKSELKRLFNSLSKSDPKKAEIFTAHLEIIEDPDLDKITRTLLSKGKSAEYSWKSGYEQQAKELSSLKSEILAERANDLIDVGKRVLGILLGKELLQISYPQDCIIIAEDLTPSVVANFDPSIVKGFCTTLGGATSHVAILARAQGIPAIVGMRSQLLLLENDILVAIDGTSGELNCDIDKNYIKRVAEVQEITNKRKADELKHCNKPATTTDGVNVEIVGNVGKPEAAKTITPNGGEGVGLLRSEFIFLDRSTAPSEDEQYEAYTTVLKSVNPSQKVVIRTLDVGGDKPLAYLPLPEEENPFLGQRGIRVSLNKPDILRTQLRALLRASVHGNLHIMFPMIGDIIEFREAKVIFEEERKSLGIDPIPVGIMIEVPSAVILADIFADEVDFFSIGTNDLTQYTMAMDRGHPDLAKKSDGLHPAVLKMIKMSVDSAHKKGKWVGVCGGLGGDPQAVPILIGLGVDELSVSIPSIPSVKAQIRTLSMDDCKKLAENALLLGTFQEVRESSPSPYKNEEL